MTETVLKIGLELLHVSLFIYQNCILISEQAIAATRQRHQARVKPWMALLAISVS